MLVFLLLLFFFFSFLLRRLNLSSCPDLDPRFIPGRWSPTVSGWIKVIMDGSALCQLRLIPSCCGIFRIPEVSSMIIAYLINLASGLVLRRNW